MPTGERGIHGTCGASPGPVAGVRRPRRHLAPAVLVAIGLVAALTVAPSTAARAAGATTGAGLVTYTVADSVVVRAMATGETRTVMATDGSYAYAGDVSPDGARLAYATRPKPPNVGSAQVGVANLLDGSNATVGPPSGAQGPVRWSFDGSRLGFTTSAPFAGRRVGIMNPDGSGFVIVPSGAAQNTHVYFADWMPDGRVLYRVAAPGCTEELHAVLPDGSVDTNLAPGPFRYLAATALPDNRVAALRIATASPCPFALTLTVDVVVMGPDGSNARVVTTFPSMTTQMGIGSAPDASGLLVSRSESADSPMEVAVVDLASGAMTRLATGSDPGWQKPFIPVGAFPPPTGPPPPPRPPARSGYWMVGQRGDVYAFGDAAYLGGAPIVPGQVATGVTVTPSGKGYWIAASGGGVYTFGDARFFGTASPLAPGETLTSLSRTPDGNGHWLFTSHGRVLTRGNAPFLGDMTGVRLNGPVLGSVATPTGKGYYMVASDGGVFSFGDAVFRGSMGGRPLNGPVVGLAPDPDGVGYWLVAGDGGIFAFDAGFRGSMGGSRLNRPVIGMVAYGDGYLMVGADGGIFAFSSTPFRGSLGDRPPAVPIAAVAPLVD